MTLTQHKIAFIGSGNIARALVAGLLAQQFVASNIWVTGQNYEKLLSFENKFQVNTTIENASAVAKCDVLVLCVKPHQLHSVCCDLKAIIQKKRPLVISVAAGVTLALLESWLGVGVPIIRSMPNTPCAIAAGVTGFVANQFAEIEQLAATKELFNSVGITFYLKDENHLDVVTALSGCGPAYVFLFIEALQQAAVAAGLDSEVAGLMTQQMIYGAARMALESGKEAAELRREVTSVGGATESALITLQQGRFHNLIAAALNSAAERSREITLQLQQEK